MKGLLGIDPGIAALLEKAPSEELDYGFVMECLKGYKSPRVKLSHLLKIKAIVRVKKGIYIFGKRFARHPYSSQVLANMIYGPPTFLSNMHGNITALFRKKLQQLQASQLNALDNSKPPLASLFTIILL